MTDVYSDEIVLLNERIINMLIKSLGDIMLLYLIITKKTIVLICYLRLR